MRNHERLAISIMIPSFMLTHNLFGCTVVTYFSALLYFLPSVLVTPTPPTADQASSLPPRAYNDTSSLEKRQALYLMAAGAFGLGFLTGRHVQSRKDADKYKPGLNRHPGSYCAESGSWSARNQVSGCFHVWFLIWQGATERESNHRRLEGRATRTVFIPSEKIANWQDCKRIWWV